MGSIDAPADWYEGFFEETWLRRGRAARPGRRTDGKWRSCWSGWRPRGAAPARPRLRHGRISLALGTRLAGHRARPERSVTAGWPARRPNERVSTSNGCRATCATAARPFRRRRLVWTAFGYFEDDAENQRVLDAVAGALAPGGLLLVDVVNLLNLARRFRERSWERRRRDDLPPGAPVRHAHRPQPRALDIRTGDGRR